MPLIKVKDIVPIEYTNPIAEQINRKRHQILVHSCIYYHFGENLISDATWTEWAKELVKLQKDYPEIAAKCKLHDVFKDFDASTGFDLPYKDPRTIRTAKMLLDARERSEMSEQETDDKGHIGHSGEETSKTTRRSLPAQFRRN